ncbi:MAG: hypothetical protein LBR16_08455 [Treponema sp.]|jgi:hypothetical protein|nr:hypothetical protein [Treponema sp.]
MISRKMNKMRSVPALLFFLAVAQPAVVRPSAALSAAENALYEAGKGRGDVSVAVLETVLENAAGIPWARTVVTQQINDRLHRFTEMKVSARAETQAQIIKDIQEQMALTAEDEAAGIGEFRGVNYYVTSKITNTGRNIYSLYIEFVQGLSEEGEANKLIATGTMEFSSEDLREAAVPILLNSMFPDMGVILTQAGTNALLKGIQQNKVQARTELAKADDAEFNGNSFEALTYRSKAKKLDRSLKMGSAGKAVEDLFSIGTGTQLVQDRDAHRLWNQNMLQMEQLFVDHPPFEIYYTPNPKQFGSPDYETETASLEFSISLRRGIDFSVAQSMLKDVASGLKKANAVAARNNRAWGFGSWPYAPIPAAFNEEKVPHFEGLKEYHITAALVDDRDRVVATQTFTLQAQLLLKGGYTIGVDSTQNLRVIFPHVPVDNLPNTHVKIVTINGIKVTGEENGDNAYMTIVPVRRLPLFRQGSSVPKDSRRVEERAQWPAVLPPAVKIAAKAPAAPRDTAAQTAAAARSADAAPDAALTPGEGAPSDAEAGDAEREAALDEGREQELARRREELARQKAEADKQRQYEEELRRIEQEKAAVAQQRQAEIEKERRAKEAGKERKRQEAAARRRAVPLHNRFGLGAAALASPYDFEHLKDGIAIKADLELGIANFTMEGVFVYPFNQTMYDLPASADVDVADDAFVMGIGGGAGYAFYSKYFVGSLTAGVERLIFKDEASLVFPYTQIKLDVVPGKKGIGIRLGYLAEFASTAWGSDYARYFCEPWAHKAGEMLIMDRLQAGLVLWM